MPRLSIIPHPSHTLLSDLTSYHPAPCALLQPQCCWTRPNATSTLGTLFLLFPLPRTLLQISTWLTLPLHPGACSTIALLVRPSLMTHAVFTLLLLLPLPLHSIPLFCFIFLLRTYTIWYLTFLFAYCPFPSL